MKKILALGLIAILVMALVGGGTWAYFSDVETSSNNLLTAGTLNLGLANTSGGESGGSITATWTSPAGWKPGDNISGILYVKNSGTINMNTVTVNITSSVSGGGLSTVNGNKSGGADSRLGAMISVNATWNNVTVSTLNGESLETANNTAYTLPSNLAAGVEKPLFLNFVFNTAADNGCQGATANVTATITGTQQ